MAGVDFPEGITPFGPSYVPRRKEDEKKVGKGKGLFRTILGKAVDEAGESEASPGAEDFSKAGLEALLDEVHETGDRLKGNPSVDLVQDYKKAVRDFVHFVVERSFAVEQKTSGRNILKRNAYFRVSVIDASLEKLAAEILAQPARQSRDTASGRRDKRNARRPA